MLVSIPLALPTAVDSSATTSRLEPGSVICVTFMPEFFGCFLIFKRTFEFGASVDKMNLMTT